MRVSLSDYNEMFDKQFTLEKIQLYNGDLNKRLARKEDRFKKRGFRYAQWQLLRLFRKGASSG